MLDIFASEYGWTPDYILNSLTREQVESLISAINRRYEKKKQAMESSMKDSKGDSSSGFGEKLTGNIPANLASRIGAKQRVTRK